MAIIVEDGTGKTDAQSYCTTAFATNYLISERVHSESTWEDSDYQEQALIWATSLLDQHMQWAGSKFTDEQKLRWPRSGLVDVDGWGVDNDEIPINLQKAVAEYAYILLSSDRTGDSETIGFSEIKVGSINLKIDSKDKKKPLPNSVLQLVSMWGVRGSEGGGVVSLSRV